MLGFADSDHYARAMSCVGHDTHARGSSCGRTRNSGESCMRSDTLEELVEGETGVGLEDPRLSSEACCAEDGSSRQYFDRLLVQGRARPATRLKPKLVIFCESSAQLQCMEDDSFASIAGRYCMCAKIVDAQRSLQAIECCQER
jgi:hypothetical protein